ncbi:hypothetical protein BDZ97DRAFT_1826892 [Flammula alnicola]|nr:hypothetical protein BDZ97DRAFT_1826892 [Flammula alnicola]
MSLNLDSKLVFKPPSTKVASGRNNLASCAHSQCSNEEKLGKPKFPVCASCKHTRYCSREHQIADWKVHKKRCKEYQDKDRTDGILAGSSILTEAQIVSNLLEDFVHLHESTFHQIFNYAYHTQLVGKEIDLSRLCATVNLEYLPIVGPNSLAPETKKFRDDFNTNRKNDSTFIQGIFCGYRIDGFESLYEPTGVKYTQWAGIYIEDVPFKLTQKWYDTMLTILGIGLVLRKVKLTGSEKASWTPGIMVQSGSKWVWKQVSLEGLARCRIELPLIKHWARRKITGVIHCPGDGSIPWVAPSNFSWED